LAGVPTILITGAAGQIGSMLRTRLARPGRTLRLLDNAPLDPMPLDTAPADAALADTALAGTPPPDAALTETPPLDTGPGEERVTASVTDLEAMTAACAGADAVIHLAAIADEAPWERIAAVNIEGTYVAFEAARRAGVPRVIYASSNHAVGFAPRSSFPVPDYAFPAPDTYYGVAKVTGEALAALYHHRYGMDAICLRILSCSWKPRSARSLSTWLSPDDAGRLFEACLTVTDPGFRVAYGVSANTRGGWVSLTEARALGYEPRDDAEDLAAEVIAEHGEPDPTDPVFAYLGGEFTLPTYDADHLK
jgi:dTDP-4-dehydrorhamnose reductase